MRLTLLDVVHQVVLVVVAIASLPTEDPREGLARKLPRCFPLHTGPRGPSIREEPTGRTVSEVRRGTPGNATVMPCMSPYTRNHGRTIKYKVRLYNQTNDFALFV